LTEEQLVLHYYGEPGDSLEAERHIEECAQCRALYASFQRVLNVVASDPVPERGEDYGAEVWRRIEAKLPSRRWQWLWAGSPALRWAFASAAMIALLAVAFLVGRQFPNRTAAPVVAADPQAREQVLVVAMVDYLDRSQMVLVELANSNASGPLDISAEQERAQELISDTRLYRQTAASTGDTSVTAILDEIERVMLDIARGPSRLSSVELGALRSRLQAEGILFKIRVVNSNMRSQEETPGSGGSPETAVKGKKKI